MRVRTVEEALAFRAKITGATAKLSDEDALEVVELFDAWSPEKSYTIGDRVRYNGQLYRCHNPITPNPVWTPDIVLAHWEIVAAPSEEGTLSNPITAAVGMRYFRDKYYLEGDDIYLCIRDDTNGEGTLLYYWPSVLVGNYFQKV